MPLPQSLIFDVLITILASKGGGGGGVTGVELTSLTTVVVVPAGPLVVVPPPTPPPPLPAGLVLVGLVDDPVYPVVVTALVGGTSPSKLLFELPGK